MRYVSMKMAAAIAILMPSAIFGAGLSITNYQLVSTQAVNSTESFLTFHADLLNTGPALASVTATVTTTDPFTIRVVPGEGTLNYAPVPGNSQVASSDTFTVFINPNNPIDLSKLQWTFQSTPTAVTANAGPNQTVKVNAVVTLDGSGSTNQSGVGMLSYSWTFTSRPPGSAATLSNSNVVMPTFMVDVVGNYVITLTVSNGTASSSASVTISTGNSPPVANPGPNQSVTVGSTVVLNGSGSSDVNGDSLTYSWKLISAPTGSNAALTGANTVSPTFVADVATPWTSLAFAPPGTTGDRAYIVQLIVNDGTADSSPASVIISTTNSSPVANAGPNQSVAPGSLVHLNGSLSTDADGDPLTYFWVLDSAPPGSQATLSNPNIVNPTFTADLRGIYVVQLVVNDGMENSNFSTMLVATETILPPTANAGANQSAQPGGVVQLQGAGTDPQNLPLTFQWALINKPATTSATLSSPSAPNPSFTADVTGTYIFQLVVNNGFVNSLPSTVTISTSSNTPPVASAGSNQVVMVGTTVTLNGSGSSDADNHPLAYSWSLSSVPTGSGATLTGANTATPTFVPDVVGVYVAQLIVNDGPNSSLPATVMITAPPLALILQSNATIAVSDTVTFQLTLTEPAPPNGVFVTLASSDPSVVTVSPAAIFISQGSTAPRSPPRITGVAPGSATITASVIGMTTASGQVQVTH